MRDIAEAIGQGLNIPVRSISQDEAAEHFGWLAGFVGIDNPTSSLLTRSTLQRTPQHAALLTDRHSSR